MWQRLKLLYMWNLLQSMCVYKTQNDFDISSSSTTQMTFRLSNANYMALVFIKTKSSDFHLKKNHKKIFNFHKKKTNNQCERVLLYTKSSTGYLCVLTLILGNINAQFCVIVIFFIAIQWDYDEVCIIDKSEPNTTYGIWCVCYEHNVIMNRWFCCCMTHLFRLFFFGIFIVNIYFFFSTEHD